MTAEHNLPEETRAFGFETRQLHAGQRPEGALRHVATTRKPLRQHSWSYTTVLWRSMQVRSTSSIDLSHQSLEKISISE